MTGYGAAAVDSEALRAAVTVRSVNHRFLDLTLHLTRRLSSLEPDIKALVRSRVARGRVELSVQATLPEAEGECVVAARPLVAGLVRTLREMQTEYGLEGGVLVSDVARFPGALEVLEPPPGPDEPHRRDVLDVVGKALDGLEQMRRSEGEKLAAELLALLQRIETAAGRIASLAEEGKAARRETLVAKASALREELGLEEARLYQEIVRLVDRSDVAEEVQRLRSHVKQAEGLVEAGGPCGKRLDFLAQELMREANTVGSKAVSSALVQEVVGLKSDIEAFREQVQNVE